MFKLDRNRVQLCLVLTCHKLQSPWVEGLSHPKLNNNTKTCKLEYISKPHPSVQNWTAGPASSLLFFLLPSSFFFLFIYYTPINFPCSCPLNQYNIHSGPKLSKKPSKNDKISFKTVLVIKHSIYKKKIRNPRTPLRTRPPACQNPPVPAGGRISFRFRIPQIFKSVSQHLCHLLHTRNPIPIQEWEVQWCTHHHYGFIASKSRTRNAKVGR